AVQPLDDEVVVVHDAEVVRLAVRIVIAAVVEIERVSELVHQRRPLKDRVPDDQVVAADLRLPSESLAYRAGALRVYAAGLSEGRTEQAALGRGDSVTEHEFPLRVEVGGFRRVKGIVVQRARWELRAELVATAEVIADEQAVAVRVFADLDLPAHARAAVAHGRAIAVLRPVHSSCPAAAEWHFQIDRRRRVVIVERAAVAILDADDDVDADFVERDRAQ